MDKKFKIDKQILILETIIYKLLHAQPLSKTEQKIIKKIG